MDDPRTRADRLLADALAATATGDPRPLCRERLRDLKMADADRYARAIEYFETQLVPAIAGGAQPLAEWVGYGRFMAELSGPGRIVAVDASGRARSYTPPPDGELVLFLPDNGRPAAITLLAPARPSAAQAATRDLLVLGKREL